MAIVVAALAGLWIHHVLNTSTLPVIRPVRDWLITRSSAHDCGEDPRLISRVTSWVYKWLWCGWCSGAWISFVAYAGYTHTSHVSFNMIEALAAAGLCGFMWWYMEERQ